MVSECESEGEVRRLREAKILELEKEIAMLKIEQRDIIRKLEEQNEAKRTVSYVDDVLALGRNLVKHSMEGWVILLSLPISI